MNKEKTHPKIAYFTIYCTCEYRKSFASFCAYISSENKKLDIINRTFKNTTKPRSVLQGFVETLSFIDKKLLEDNTVANILFYTEGESLIRMTRLEYLNEWQSKKFIKNNKEPLPNNDLLKKILKFSDYMILNGQLLDLETIGSLANKCVSKAKNIMYSHEKQQSITKIQEIDNLIKTLSLTPENIPVVFESMYEYIDAMVNNLDRYAENGWIKKDGNKILYIEKWQEIHDIIVKKSLKVKITIIK